mgnify:CR=1 FL=1
MPVEAISFIRDIPGVAIAGFLPDDRGARRAGNPFTTRRGRLRRRREDRGAPLLSGRDPAAVFASARLPRRSLRLGTLRPALRESAAGVG